MDKQQQQNQKQEDGFTLVSLDESFFFYDSLVRRVRIEEKKRPIVTVTGSHKHSCIFGAISMSGKNYKQQQQLFRQYDRFNGETFLNFLKKIHTKFPKCYLFMDKASPHYKSKKVIKYFEQNTDTIPTNIISHCSYLPISQVCNISKHFYKNQSHVSTI